MKPGWWMDQVTDEARQARRELIQDAGATWATLFASSGTLICCALPILLVAFGLGATVAAVTESAPFLVTLARYKAWLFVVSGCMLAASGYLLYRPGRVCPSDPQLASVCAGAQRWNKRVLWIAAGTWAIGFFTAYLLYPIRLWLDR